MSNCSLIVSFPTILILLLCSSTSFIAQNSNSLCIPSSYGNITITYPFRLTTDHSSCGHRDPIFALECHRNRTILRSKSRHYHVQTITYTNFSLRLSDPGLDSNTYSSCPIYSSTDDNLYSRYMYYVSTYSTNVAFINCIKHVDNPLYVENPLCGNTSVVSFSNSSRVYSYVTVRRVLVSDLEEVWTYDHAMVGTAWPPGLEDDSKKNYSYSEIHNLMANGFELSWFHIFCDECDERGGDCAGGR